MISCPRSGRSAPVGQHVPPEEVLAFVLVYPRCSTRDISAACGQTAARVWQILQQRGTHPYCAVVAHGLQPGDAQRRFDWCNFVMNQVRIHPTLLAKILWTDEFLFTRFWVFTRHNVHYWGLDNPSWVRHVRHQVRWSINVSCAIWNNRVIGPVFYEER